MRKLVAMMLAVVPALAAGDTFKDLDDFCRVTNGKFGAAVAEIFCTCLDAELKKRITEQELADYFGRPPSPEDRAVVEKATEAATVCREKVQRELTSI